MMTAAVLLAAALLAWALWLIARGEGPQWRN